LAGSDDKTDKTADEQAALNDSSLATSDEIARKAVRLARSVMSSIGISASNLSANPCDGQRQRLIEITSAIHDPELALTLSTGSPRRLVRSQPGERSGTSRKTNDFLQERISNLQADIKSDEEKLVDLTQKEGILKTDGDQTIVIERLSGLNKQLLDAENTRKDAEANLSDRQQLAG